MSIEMHVFFRGKLPSKAALSRALKELGFPFTIRPATGSLERQNGYMPMLLRRDEIGVEFDVFDDPAALAEFADVGADPSFNRIANFRWAGDMQEAVAGLCCAAALAKLVNGVVFDAEEGTLRSADEAIAFARHHLKDVVKPEDVRRPGTRPSDIKRYLKPLLKLRPDLALVGRHLLIRPVRHILRGALLDRTSDKYCFQIWRCIDPLYEPPGHVGWGGCIHEGEWKVYEPYFEPLLLDAFKEDVFDDVGKIKTLPELPKIDPFTALVLWGRLEQAAEYIESQRTAPPDPHDAGWDTQAYRDRIAEKRRALLANGIPALCEEYHRKERETAEAMKLGDVWEPSPFPVELSGGDRDERASEPLFATTPWVGSAPNLWRDMPTTPGEVCFARLNLKRGGRQILWMPLTAQEAEEKHRDHQAYALGVRLPGGAAACLRHSTGWSPHEPERPTKPAYIPNRDFHLDVYGSFGRISDSFYERLDERDTLQLQGSTIYDPSGDSLWLSTNIFRERKISIHDSRGGQHFHTKRAMTDADMSLCRFPLPRFGDVWSLLDRLRAYLEREGIDSALVSELRADHSST